jgi:hypothetical protein
MPQQSITTSSLANRRRSRRWLASGHVKTECRKGAHGLGRNLAVTTLDLSETGARLLVRAAMAPGEDVEVLLAGVGVARALKRVGKVVWALLLSDGSHAIGVVFDKRLSYAELQRLARV